MQSILTLGGILFTPEKVYTSSRITVYPVRGLVVSVLHVSSMTVALHYDRKIQESQLISFCAYESHIAKTNSYSCCKAKSATI